jgi:hypothetical protein
MAKSLSFFYLPCEYQEKPESLRLLSYFSRSSLPQKVKNIIEKYVQVINPYTLSNSEELTLEKFIQEVKECVLAIEEVEQRPNGIVLQPEKV